MVRVNGYSWMGDEILKQYGPQKLKGQTRTSISVAWGSASALTRISLRDGRAAATLRRAVKVGCALRIMRRWHVPALKVCAVMGPSALRLYVQMIYLNVCMERSVAMCVLALACSACSHHHFRFFG